MCLGNGVEQTDGPTDRLCKCKCNGGPDPVKYIRQCLDTELEAFHHYQNEDKKLLKI